MRKSCVHKRLGVPGAFILKKKLRQRQALRLLSVLFSHVVIKPTEAVGGKVAPGRRTFIFVNNRLEGNALGTVAAMMDGTGLDSGS